LEVVVRNWPDAALLTEIVGLSPASPPASDQDRAEGQKAGLLGIAEIGGKVYMPAGQTTGGVSIDVTMRANALLNAMTNIRKSGFGACMRSIGADPTLDWTPAVRGEAVGFESTDGFVTLGQMA
jgi:hypothetical protein